jgi:hypothetical protein
MSHSSSMSITTEIAALYPLLPTDRDGMVALRGGAIEGTHAGETSEPTTSLTEIAVQAQESGLVNPNIGELALRDEFIVGATLAAFKVRQVREQI